MVVEACSGHDLGLGFFGDLPHDVDITSEVDGGEVDQGSHTKCLGLLHFVGGMPDRFRNIHPVLEALPHAPIADHDVFVHQGEAEVFTIDRSENSVYLAHAASF